jgi:hypothetical protein
VFHQLNNHAIDKLFEQKNCQAHRSTVRWPDPTVPTSLLFGVGPMMVSTRLDAASGLREGSWGTARSRLRSTLIVVEFAVSVVLLIG